MNSKTMFKIEKVINVGVQDLHEWEDNPVKRVNIPDKELRQSLEDDGMAVDTIAVIPNGKGYIVVDGNRRLRLAKELNLKGSFMAKVYSKNVDRVALAIKLNGIGTAWDRQTYTQFVANHPERIDLLPKRYRLNTKKMYDMLGDDYDWFAKNCKPNAFDWGVQLSNYIGMGEDEEFVKRTVLWVGRYKLVGAVRRAINEGNPAKHVIKKAILDNKPLRVSVVVADE
jgi:hypothetical protein